jgi:hypothetical protein
MNLPWQNHAQIFAALLAVGILTGGCVSKSEAKLRERNAFLEGQNVTLQQQAQAAAQNAVPNTAQITVKMQVVMVIGAVQNPQVPWVAGLTLAQAIATANYVGQAEPKQIIITRNGESATLDAGVLLNGKDIPLEIGDVIELR